MSKPSFKRNTCSTIFAVLALSFALPAAHADEAASTEDWANAPVLEFRGTISGDVLDLNDGKGPETKAVEQFLRTGKNPYNDNEAAIKNGYTLFSTACSGCHGHLAEGKLGPALSDDYWTYPKNAYDKGLFETIYGGAQGMMGPQRGLITKDEILQIMSWVRSIYEGDPKKAKWRN
ncbi:MAG TPA: cytochrome c(L), periplasmic [Methylophilaceae bacterium]|jgi:cytochrome c-L